MRMMMQQSACDEKLTDPGIVFDILNGLVRMAVLDAALKMEMAEHLARNSEPKAIAEALGVEADEKNLVYFMDAMVAMGFAEKKNGEYANTLFSESYLRKDSPTYLGELVTNLYGVQCRNINRIPELVRQGPPEVKQQNKLDSEERWTQSVRHLAAYHKAGMAERVADLVSALPEFPRMERMLDLGCGPGVMCMAVVSRHPVLKGVLCDQPPVLKVAREEIAAAKLESRISTISGDYNEVDLGQGYDLIWASHCLYFVKDLQVMLSRLLDALNPGGVFVSFHEGLSCEETQPAGVVLSRLSLALEGQDVSFKEGQIAALMQDAGFASVETKHIPFPLGPMEMVIARKKG